MPNLASTPPPKASKGAIVAPHTFTVHGDLMVSFTLPGMMTDEQWDRFVAAFWNNPIKYYLGAAVGTVDISSLQRQRIIDVLTGKAITTAAITDDAVIRGIATAVSWFGARIKAFSWKDLAKGLDYLNTPPEVAAAVLADLQRRKAAGRID